LMMLPPPAALPEHRPQLVLHAQEHAEDIGVESGGIRLGGLLGHRAELTLGSRVVHGSVQAAEPLDGPFDQALNVGFLPDVGEPELGLRAEGAEFFHELLAFLLAAAGGDDLRPLACEGQGCGAADPGQCAGDEDDGGGHGTSLELGTRVSG
jgi:hypothetical protein